MSGKCWAKIAPLLLAALLVVGFSGAARAAQAAKVARVSDGDTLVLVHKGKRVKLRVIGIDTPETKPGRHLDSQAKRLGISQARLISWGRRAKSEVERLCGPGARVKLEYDRKQPRRDRYGRLLAHLRLGDGRLLSAVLIEKGLAQVYRRFQFDHKRELLRLERSAISARRGLWADARRFPR